jgi:hypothetical protein
MNINYEINQNIPRKKADKSKYTYQKQEINTQIYIFELVLRDKFNNQKIIRKIKKCNHGNLISNEDNINYNIVNKYKLTVVDANNPNNLVIIDEIIDHNLTTNTFLNNEIYIEINQTNNNFMDINYHINF